MLDVSKINSSISGLVGYKQPFNPDYAIVDAGNLLSESGYYVNSNPFAKIEYIKDCQDYKDISDADFNTVLSNIIKDSTSNVLNQVFNDSSYIDRQLLYKNALNKSETETLPNGFVGYRIEIDDTKSVAFNITRAFLDFDGTGDVEILLFNSSKKEAIKTETVTISSDHQEIELNWILNDTDTVYKGEYFIGYINDGSLSVSPYKRNYRNSGVSSYITHLDISKVLVSNHSTNTLFDLNDTLHLSESTGLNLDITVYNDYTDLVLQNKFIFARAIMLSSTISCLKIYVASLRSNRNERQSEELYQKVMLEINGTRRSDEVINIEGLKPSLLNEINSIKESIQSIKEGYFGNGFEVITQM